jgi:cytochrome P450
MTGGATSSLAEPTCPVVDFGPLDQRVHDDYWNILTQLREGCPVGWSTSQWSMAKSGQWILNTHREVMAAATNWQTFSSADGVSTFQFPLDILRLIPVETDPPLHREIRKALNPFFTAHALGEKAGEINRIVNQLMAECLEQDGPVDFVASFTAKLPPIVYLGPAFLDSTEEQGNGLLELVNILLTKPELTMEAAPKLLAWCAELLESRRTAGRREDLAGLIAHMGFGEEGLELEEKQRVEILNLAVMAGMETTMGGLGATAWLLATRPDLRERLRTAEERTIDRAIEEFLRFSTPVPQLSRTLTHDTEVQGCPMRKGDRVLLNWAAANLDPEQFPNPLDVDIERANLASHVAFGAGIHRCLGAHLARREIKAMVRAIAELSEFRLAPGAQIAWRASMARGPVAVPILMAR